jgi:hypothetical protein
MYSLDKAVEQVLRWTAARQKERQQVVALLGELVRHCEEASKVWSGYLASPGPDGDKFAIVTWIGAERAKQLHELNLKARADLQALAKLAGPPVSRVVGLDDDVIEMAYRSLMPGETGPQAAQASIDALKQRIQYLQGLRARIEKTPPAKGGSAPAKKATKSAAGKPAAKKPAKKAAKAKKAARKKKRG